MKFILVFAITISALAQVCCLMISEKYKLCCPKHSNVDRVNSKLFFCRNNNTQIVMTTRETKQNNRYAKMKWFVNNNETDMNNSSVMSPDSVTSLTKREPPLQLLKITTTKAHNKIVPKAVIANAAAYKQPLRAPYGKWMKYSPSSTTATTQSKIKDNRKLLNAIISPKKRKTLTKKPMQHTQVKSVKSSTTSSTPSGQKQFISKRKPLPKNSITKRPLHTQPVKSSTTSSIASGQNQINFKRKPTKTVKTSRTPQIIAKKPSPRKDALIKLLASSTIPLGHTAKIKSKRKSLITIISLRKSKPITKKPKTAQIYLPKHAATKIKAKQPTETVKSSRKPKPNTKKPSQTKDREVAPHSTSSTIPSGRTGIKSKFKPSKTISTRKKPANFRKHSTTNTIPSGRNPVKFKAVKAPKTKKPPKIVKKKPGISLAYNRPYVSSSSPSSSESSSSSRTKRRRRKPRITTSTKHKPAVRKKNDDRIALPHDQRKKLHISENPRKPNYNRPSESSSKSTSSYPKAAAKGFNPKKTWSSSSTEVIKQVITKTLIESHVHRKHLGSNGSDSSS